MKVKICEVPSTTGDGDTYVAYEVHIKKWWWLLWSAAARFYPRTNESPAEVLKRATEFATSVKSTEEFYV